MSKPIENKEHPYRLYVVRVPFRQPVEEYGFDADPRRHRHGRSIVDATDPRMKDISKTEFDALFPVLGEEKPIPYRVLEVEVPPRTAVLKFPQNDPRRAVYSRENRQEKTVGRPISSKRRDKMQKRPKSREIHGRRSYRRSQVYEKKI
ncbi:unnamed protein product [Caenorhabditis auriculariae]|uniref:Uncharacterized protein n=1 Tax=Caenorhabditis auriculariae TaxID=2777116 RepID=A0A8S1H245_9PELO|nr:unnamed protein product [Caenorhabditis auriculariae]